MVSNRRAWSSWPAIGVAITNARAKYAKAHASSRAATQLVLLNEMCVMAVLCFLMVVLSCVNALVKVACLILMAANRNRHEAGILTVACAITVGGIQVASSH